MMFAALIAYSADYRESKAVGPAHHTLRALLDTGRLFAAGPFRNALGALWICKAESLDAAEKKLRDDPYHAAGVAASWQRLAPLAIQRRA